MSRELLEKAARAAGIDLTGYHFFAEKNQFVRYWEPSSEGTQRFEVWGPLTDDGDAFRLAVKLHIDFSGNDYDIGFTNGWAQAVYADNAACQENYSDHNGDPYAATRLAIVRAAAAMGEKP